MKRKTQPAGPRQGPRVPWFTREQWARLREVAVDPVIRDTSYEDWRLGNKATMRRFRQEGVYPRKCPVELDAFFQWCDSRGVPVELGALFTFMDFERDAEPGEELIHVVVDLETGEIRTRALTGGESG